jgi:hypothetical protein
LIFLGDHTKNFKVVLLSKVKVKNLRAGGLSNKEFAYSLKRNFFTGTIRRIYHTNNINQLGYYLAGLIEGDGSIILRKGDREKTSPKFVFTFHKNEIRLFEKIKEILDGTGSINIEPSGIGRYSITNADAVIKLINMVNGKFRTPKIVALHKAIDNLNQ